MSRMTDLGSEGQEGLDGLVGGNEGHELGVNELHLVNLLADKVGVQLISHSLSIPSGGS